MLVNISAGSPDLSAKYQFCFATSDQNVFFLEHLHWKVYSRLRKGKKKGAFQHMSFSLCDVWGYLQIIKYFCFVLKIKIKNPLRSKFRSFPGNKHPDLQVNASSAGRVLRVINISGILIEANLPFTQDPLQVRWSRQLSLKPHEVRSSPYADSPKNGSWVAHMPAKTSIPSLGAEAELPLSASWWEGPSVSRTLRLLF